MNTPEPTPKSSDAETALALEEERPQSPWMIGLILMIFGVLGLFTLSMNLYLAATNLGGVRGTWTSLGMSMQYIYVTLSISILASAWMLFIGAQLLRYKDIGRRHYNGYFLYLLVSTLVTFVYQFSVLPSGLSLQAALNGMLGTIAGNTVLVLGFAGLRYLLNKENTRASLS